MQVPGYLAKKGELKELGIDEIIIFCVNDGAVMKAWAKDQGIGEDYYTMMGDPCAYLSCLSLPQLSHTQHSTQHTQHTQQARAHTRRLREASTTRGTHLPSRLNDLVLQS